MEINKREKLEQVARIEYLKIMIDGRLNIKNGGWENQERRIEIIDEEIENSPFYNNLVAHQLEFLGEELFFHYEINIVDENSSEFEGSSKYDGYVPEYGASN
tara:strand:+ start:416 stop:721 length:306 start_codon:yes stop_codon:yes gene_type:complete